MVFESLVVSLLNKYLGKYVTNLDSSNLDLGIWNGNAVLTELTLKDDALDDLDLPVEVKSGYIGKLALTIPWSNLYTKPVVVKIEDVFIVATPVTDHEFDAKQAEERLKAAKRRRLLAVEKSTKPKSKAKLPDDYTFIEKLTAQIIKNVQVFIKNIHVRYEDKVTSPDCPFAVGITLKHLTAETTDELWKPYIVEGTVRKVFKFVSLDSLSLYWNTNITSSQRYGGNEAWKSLLRSSITTKNTKDDDYEYVMEPFSIQAHVKIDQRSAVQSEEPKVTIEVFQQDMILGLSRTQFHSLMNLIESFELLLTNEPYRKYRPSAPLSGNARAWWCYAYSAILEEKIRTWSWSNIRRHRALYHDYKNLYKIKLFYDDKEIENVNLNSKLLSIEDELDLSSILIAREHAQAEFKINPGVLDEPEEKSEGWWSWMFGSSSENKKETENDLSSSLSLAALSPTEKQRLYEALDYSENLEKTNYPEEYIKYLLLFSMENFEVRLLNEIKRNLAYVSMTGVSGSLKHRPSASNTSCFLEVNDVNIYGHSSNLDEPQPHLLAVQKLDKDQDLILFDITFDINPIHVSADYAVFLKLEPVKIVYDTNTVMQIVNFFKVSHSKALQELTEVASSGLQELQAQTRASLEYAVSQQTVIFFDVNLRSPRVVLPEYGAMESALNLVEQKQYYCLSGTVLVFDFGHLMVKTNLNSKTAAVEAATESELENMLSDNFQVTLSEMQIILADKSVDWQSAHTQATSPYHLLPASQIDLEVVRNTNGACSLLPQIKLTGVLPLLDIKLSEEKYQQLMQFISNIPLLTEPMDVDDGPRFHSYPQTLSRHSSRLSLAEVANIQSACREALSASTSLRDNAEFKDAEEEPSSNEEEEEWFMALEELPDSQNKPEVRSVSSTRIPETKDVNQVTMSGEFSIKKVSIVFNKFVDFVDQPYINFVISDLGTQVLLFEWEMNVTAKLGSIHLMDYLFKDVDGSTLTVLSSIADKDLIYFSYRKVNTDCPYLNTSCEGVQHFIKTEFNALNVLLHREGITTFQNFVLALFERSEKPNFRKLGQRMSSYLEVIPENSSMKVDDLSRNEKEVVQDSGKTKAVVALGEVLVTLSAHDQYFSVFTVNGLCLDVFLEEEKTHVKASLDHFSVQSLEQDTLYDKILTVEDDNLCDVEVTMYSKGKETQSDPLNVDIDVFFSFGRLRFVFLSNFVSALQNFFASFASAETRHYAQQATSQAVQIQVENIRDAAPKIGLRVNINAPVIKVPVDSLSNTGVIVDLGRLQVNNKLQYHNTGSTSVLTDVISVTLDLFQVLRFNAASSWSGTHNLIDPTGLAITVTRCLEDFCATIPSLDVEVVLEQLAASVDESDFKLLMKTWRKNVQQALMDEVNERLFLDDDISNMPEVEQHQMEKADGRRTEVHEQTVARDKNMKLNAVVDKVSLQVPTCINNEREPNLELSIHKLRAAIEFADRNTQGSASLGALFLFDHRNKGFSSNPLPVLQSSRDKDLISVYYKAIAKPQSSEGTQTMEVLASVIKLHLEEKSILGVQELVTTFLESSKLSSSHASLVSATHGKASDSRQKACATEDDQEKRVSNFKFTINLSEVDLILSRRHINVARAVIEDVFTEVMASGGKFVIYSRQKGLSVTDLNPRSNYKEIVTIEGSKLFDFEYQSIPRNVNTSEYSIPEDASVTSPHSQLSLHIGKVRFVFLYKLIAEIQAFMQVLVSPETTSYSYELAQKTVQDQLQTIENQGLRIALKINIEAPIVLYPRHSQSVDFIIADLGQLHAQNTFTTSSPADPACHVTETVVIDKTDVTLQSVELSRGHLNGTSISLARRLLIQPVKMSMVISRSMKSSARWLPYMNVEMKMSHIEMDMDETDYQLLIRALQQNYAEAATVVFSDVPVSIANDVDIADSLPLEEKSKSTSDSVEEAEHSSDVIVIEFKFVGLSLTLYNKEDVEKHSGDSVQHHDVQARLCTCELQESYGSLVTHSDTSINLHLYLYGCIIEDARPSTVTAFPRMLSPRTEQEHGKKKRRPKNAAAKRPSMIEVLYKQTPTGEMKVELTLQDPTLYISFPLLWSLRDFFTVTPDERELPFMSDGPLAHSTIESISSSSTGSYILKVTGALKNPEIVLLGDPENPKSSALIVQTTIEFAYKLVDNQQNFTTSSKELVVHSCRYPERERTLYKVVKPCAVDFRYSYPGSDCEGQEIRLEVPEMKVKISPLLLRTLLAIYNSFYGQQEVPEDTTSEQFLKVEDSEELWRPQPILKDNWYKGRAQVRVPSRIRLNTTVTEKFSMEVKSVRATLYNEVMAHRIPLLLINSNIELHVRDWSSELKLEADLSVEAWYHNEKMAAWEPLMESEETLSGRRLWQLQLKVFKADSHLLSFSPDSKKQKATDQEDFMSLTSSPVFLDGRICRTDCLRPPTPDPTELELDFQPAQTEHRASRECRDSREPRYFGSVPSQFSVQRHDFEAIDRRPPLSPTLSVEEPNRPQSDVIPIEIDEVFSVAPSPRSPLSSETRSDVAQDIPQAMYLVLSSYDIMQLTVTRLAVEVLSDVAQVFTAVTSVSPSEPALPESPFVIVNELGIHTSVSVSHRHEVTQDPTPNLTVSRRKRIDVSDVIDCAQNSKIRSERYRSLGELEERSKVLSQIKDDSELWEQTEHIEGTEIEGDTVDGPLGGNLKISKPSWDKRFVRSQSMPTRDMRSMIQLAEEKERASRAGIEAVLKESGENVEVKVGQGLLIQESGNNTDEPSVVPEATEGLWMVPKDIEGHSVVPRSGEECSVIRTVTGSRSVVSEVTKGRKRSKGGSASTLGSIKEEQCGEGDIRNVEHDVKDCWGREAKLEHIEESEKEEAAPSVISGAFATMGLMAGISGHPVSSNEFIGQLEERHEVFFERPEYKKADDYISIQVDGFEELSFVLVTHAGRFLYQLSPKKLVVSDVLRFAGQANGRFYYIVVQIEIQHGQKRVLIRSPLQIKNNLDIKVDLLESGTRKMSTVEDNDPKDGKIDFVEPKGIVNVPLFSAHKGNLFIRPAGIGFKKSTLSVSWKDFSDSNRTTLLSCLPEEDGPKYTYSIKVLCEKDSLNTFPSRMAPHHIIQLNPTMTFCNCLPCTVTLKLEEPDVSEMSIAPGKRCLITSVNTYKTSTFLLKVLQYMKTSWSGSFKLGGDYQRDVEVEMTPEETVYNKLLIKLDYMDRGCLVINFYSPYWIINKTNLTIKYKASRISSESFKQLANDKEPLLYDSPSKTKKIMLKLHGCDWSNSFSLDAVGNAGCLVCKELKTSREYEMAISIELSHNTLTKIITILPKFVIINKTEHELSICEIKKKPNLWIFIKPNQCLPYWPQTKSNAFLVKISDSILKSKVLRINSLFPTIFRVGDGTLLEMNSEISESSTTIVFKATSSTSLPRIENVCEETSIALLQKDAGSSTIVSPLTSIIYLWDEPGGDLTLLWQPENYRIQPVELPLNKDGFGDVKLLAKRRKTSKGDKKVKRRPSWFIGCECVGQRSTRGVSLRREGNEPDDIDCCERRTSRQNVDKTVYWVSFLYGVQRVVVFTDDPVCAKEARKHCEGEAVSLELFLSLDGVRLSVVNKEPSEVMYLGVSSATSVWEVEKSRGKWKMLSVETSSLLEEAWRNDVHQYHLDKDVEVDFDTMTMSKPYRGALNRRYEPGLWVHYCTSTNYESFFAKVNRVQIDNQMFGTIFPFALYPSPLPVSVNQRYGFKPFCEISTIYRNDTRHNLLHLRYFKVLVQEMNVKLEKDFLLAIYKLIYGDGSAEDDEEAPFQEHLRNISLSLEDTLTESGSLDTQRLFLEFFHLSPLKINLSLSLGSNLYESEKHRDEDSDVFQFLVDSFGSPLTEVNDVQIKLACFERAGLFVTQGSLVSCARRHYTWQALRQFHAIVLGLDVLGNPYGLLTDLREGVKDLFYEPYQGIVLGPQEFASGVVRGVKSLLGHAIGGTAGAMSRITGTFGQAFASLSFDHDYRMKRRLRLGSGPAGITEGVAMGGKSFLMGVVFGVSGLVTKPYQGARDEGVEGFFKGFGKGVLGLVTRPTVGVFDMVSTTLDGIRRSAEQGGEDVVVRMRIPRFNPPDAPLRPYIEYQANGNGILKSLPRSSEMLDDFYVDHIPLPKDGHPSIALFTNMRLMEVYQTMFWGEWKISANVPYGDINDKPRFIPGAIEIMTKNEESKKMESTDQSTLHVVLKKLDEQLYHYRATK